MTKKYNENKLVDPEGSMEDNLVVNEPFNPRDIIINRKAFTVETVINRLHRKSIVLAPDYQRKEVWGEEKKSQLIESLLLRIPLPSFYVAEGDSGQYEVVDGQQRLSALRDFFFSDGITATQRDGNGFKLEGLEYLKKLEGCNYNTLPESFKENLEEGQFDFIVIDNKTPEDVKFVIFSRINRGGVALSDQEVRHALHNGAVTKLLERLSLCDSFSKNFSKIFSSNDMQDREVILRALSFMVRHYTTFKKYAKMKDFLSDTMLIINAMPDFIAPRFLRKFKEDERNNLLITNIEVLERQFKLGLSRAIELFEKHAFRRSWGNNKRSPVNKALFEIWIALFGKMNRVDFEFLLKNKELFFKKYIDILNDESFKRSITRDVLIESGVIKRYETLERLIDDVFKTAD